jgi:hypothetical protein
MINLTLEVAEVEALLKHIEQSAKALIAKVHAQAAPQVAGLNQPTEEEKPVE